MILTLRDRGISKRHTQRGVSKAADHLKMETENYRSKVPSQIVDWKDELDRELVDIYTECSSGCWDGYRATRITPDAMAGARRFLRELPDGIDVPEVVPESSGSIAFEWDRGQDMLLSISVEGDNIVYAGILGASNNRSGQASLSLGMPYEVEQILSMHFSKA